VIPREIREVLKQRGYKLTQQRRAVLEALAHARSHLSAQAVHENVRAERPSIGLATVYRTLHVLKEVGVVCELPSYDAMHTYTLAATADHHHHLVCSGCGTVVDFTTASLDELAQRLELETGFVIENHMLEFAGICSDCTRNPDADEGGNSIK